jgi:ethanolamine transporter
MLAVSQVPGLSDLFGLPSAERPDAILDGKSFVASCRTYKDGCSVPLIIGTITALFTIIAGFDYINGNKYGYGEKYYAAWEAMAPMAGSMIGITSLVPVFRLFFTPIIGPLFEAVATHRAMFGGILLPVDVGGYPMALKLAKDNLPVAMYSSVLLGSMFGATIGFNIPVGLAMISRKNHIFFAFGTLIGFLSVPFGCIVGGLTMAASPYDLSVADAFKNMIAVVIITVLIAVPLYLKPFPTLRGFIHFSSAIQFLMTFGAMIAIFQEYTLLRFPLWSRMIDDDGEDSFMTILLVVSSVASVLTGTIPMIHFITTMIGPTLQKVTQKAGLTAIDASGLVSVIATAVPMYGLFDEMSRKGMIVAAAFEVGAAYVLGDHLAYVGAVEPDMIVPMIVGKLFAGAVAIGLAILTGNLFVVKGTEALERMEAQENDDWQEKPEADTQAEADGNAETDPLHTSL